MQIVELLMNGSYGFEMYVPWKSHIPFICTLDLFTSKICQFLKI